MTDQHLAIIVLAAGQGTRMKSATPKVLHHLAGVPLIGHVLATARQLDPSVVIVVVRHERDAVAEAVTGVLPEAVIIDQDETPGTGRAVELALAALPDDFTGDVVVVSADVPLLDAGTLSHLVEAHRAAEAAATLLSANLIDATGYGRIVRASDGTIAGIVEHKDANDEQRTISEVNSGTYVFEVTTLRTQLTRVEMANVQNEKYLTDVIGLLNNMGARVTALAAAESWIVEGVNDRAQLSDAAVRLNQMIVRGWQREGVTILDPSSTWIDLTVDLAPDIEILPGTQLRGATVIGTGSVIGPDTTLVDCEVGENATVKRTDATLSVIGTGASVGPFSYLRPGTYLDHDGKIGTFVETKNSHIGAGSKVPHLSYIGDTEIGEQSNIGAGTITANYDGVSKSKTFVGSHVRTGSHNVFVAPVSIGDGAYTGAGTVVRKDVKPGSLAISVAPQRNMAGWVEANRPGTAAADAAASAGIDTD